MWLDKYGQSRNHLDTMISCCSVLMCPVGVMGYTLCKSSPVTSSIMRQACGEFNWTIWHHYCGKQDQLLDYFIGMLSETALTHYKGLANLAVSGSSATTEKTQRLSGEVVIDLIKVAKDQVATGTPADIASCLVLCAYAYKLNDVRLHVTEKILKSISNMWAGEYTNIEDLFEWLDDLESRMYGKMKDFVVSIKNRILELLSESSKSISRKPALQYKESSKPVLPVGSVAVAGFIAGAVVATVVLGLSRNLKTLGKLKCSFDIGKVD